MFRNAVLALSEHHAFARPLVNASRMRGSKLWHLTDEAGLGVCVFNVPATYPPEPVNGVGRHYKPISPISRHPTQQFQYFSVQPWLIFSEICPPSY